MRREKIGIAVTKLPKMGGGGENYGNQVAVIVREEREIFDRNFGMLKKKNCGIEN